MKIGFDNDKYLTMQSEHIRDRISKFDNKLYLEFGGKLFDDYHASRVLPGFEPDSKLRMLMQLSDQAEIVIVISAADIDKNKMRGDLGITYDEDVLRLIDAFTERGLYVGSVCITRAVAFGHFQRLLADYPAETLHETIKDFHNTPDRLEKFKKAVAEDICGRAASVQKEIDFILEREELTHALYDLQLDGRLPLRVTHNDTKLNNIMIDDETGKAICVIDLDTVMPGLTANDFGDSIRFGASTALEDEQDLSKVSCDLHLFDVYARGFIEGCGGALTDLEIDMLPMGAILMTFENGIRFLTDHLEGDHYFHIHREGHNLDRCRTQLTLVKDMQEKLPQMNAIIQKYK